MTDNAVYVIRNSKQQPCKTCSGQHEFISRPSENTRCGTPVAFSYDQALEVAKIVGVSEDDIQRPPEGMMVVLDKSARKLPTGGGTNDMLSQHVSKTTLM
jgi:hypothetical protein